jgi:excinuclease ABC subunit A
VNNELRNGATIRVRGAREGGLQNVDIDIPLNTMCCFWGASGSGHRAFMERVLYAESCTQYMKSLNPVQRKGIVGAKRVDVDSIDGLPPVVNYLDNGTQPSVGLAAYLGIESRLAAWMNRYGTWHCPECDGICLAYQPESVEAALFSAVGKTRVLILAPLAQELIDERGAIWKQLRSVGFIRVRIGGRVVRIEDIPEDWKGEPVEVVVDRLVPSEKGNRRFLEGVRSARSISGGQTHCLDEQGGLWRFNRDLTCVSCGEICKYGEGDSLASNLRYGDFTWSSLKSKTVREILSVLGEERDRGEEWTRILYLLVQLGLENLPIQQRVDTLSHSEWLRVRLASSIESSMSGIVYLFGGIVSSVEGASKEWVLKGIETLVEQGNTVLISDRSLEVHRASRHHYAFSNGQISKGLSSVIEEVRDEPLFVGETLPWEIVGDGFWGRVDAKMPRGAIISVVGKPGCGKSRLLQEVIAPLLSGKGRPYEVRWIGGKPRVHTTKRSLNEGLLVDALGISGPIAQIYALTPGGVDKAFPAEFYRLDKVGGRCPSCAGTGTIGLSMEFVEDIESECPACRGERFRPEVLDVTHRGKTIAQVLAMSVKGVYEFMKREKKIAGRLGWLMDRGFGHLRLSEDLAQLEWPEAVRLQWVIGLKGRPSDRDFILADGFTESMHAEDVNNFLNEFKRVAQAGGTVVVADGHPRIRAASSAVLEIVHSEKGRRLRLC